MPDLALIYEHPEWFKPLFSALDRRGVDYAAIRIDDHLFDFDSPPPAPVIFNRLAMSSFLRQDEHAIFYAQALFAQWSAAGAQVINGSAPLAIDTSKARQLSLIRALGYGIPATRVIHRREDAGRAAEGLRFPVVVKPNIGGSGSGVTRFESVAEIESAITAGSIPLGIDGVGIVQEYVPPRDGLVYRAETLDGSFIYAISLSSDGATFDLCPADVCAIGRPPVAMVQATPDAETVAEVEAIAKAAQLDIGGIEYMIDARDGKRRYYDINGLSNFVANPLTVLGWDPHEKLVDYLVGVIQNNKEKSKQ